MTDVHPYPDMAAHGRVAVELRAARDRGMHFRTLPSHGVIRAEGGEFPDLLQRLSTNDVRPLTSARAVETLLTTNKGRVVDVVLALRDEAGVLLHVSPGHAVAVMTWLDKYTIMEDVRYSDVSPDWMLCEIAGALTSDVTAAMCGRELAAWEASACEIAGAACTAVLHESVCGAGLRIIAPSAHAAAVLAELRGRCLTLDVPECGEESHMLWRIGAAVPAVGRELTDLTNPLECGAAAAVSFTKGCYIGQEVIARLDTYDKVQRHLRAVRAEGFEGALHSLAAQPPGVPLLAEGQDAGFLTSLVCDPLRNAWIGLGCVRLAHAESGTVLAAGDSGVRITVA